MMLIGVCSAGFRTTQLPAASAGASFQHERAFLGADARREVAEVIDGERNVRGACLADRLAVVDGLDRGDELQILRHAVGDLVEERGALGRRRIAPGVLRLMGGVERKLDVGRLRPGDLADRLARDGADIVEIPAIDWGHPVAADEVVVAGPQGYARI
jgi:hypothetical protein